MSPISKSKDVKRLSPDKLAEMEKRAVEIQSGERDLIARQILFLHPEWDPQKVFELYGSGKKH